MKDRFERALAGVNYQMIPLHHRQLHTYAQNVDGRPALLIRVDRDYVHEVEGTRGIGVYLDAPDTPIRFLRFQSEEQGLTVMFEAVVGSLFDASAPAEDNDDALDLLLDNFDELRLMFATRGGHLSESGIRGLFAELLMLLELRDAGFSQIEAVTAWQGPYRTAKDFLLPHGRAVEVKSIRRANHRIRVANVDQLDCRGEDLRLAILQIDRCAPGNGRGLLDIVDEAKAWIFLDPAARIPLVQAFATLGLDIDDAYYQRWHFETGEWRWYSVPDEFPRVRADQVPSPISRVSFTLDTDQIDAFSVSPFWEASEAR